MGVAVLVGLGCTPERRMDERQVVKESASASGSQAPAAHPGPARSATATPVAQPAPVASIVKGGPVIVITSRAQREAAVDKYVNVIGTLARSKIPTAVGIDVGDADHLSDKKVIVRGVLRKTIVTKDPIEKSGGSGVAAGRGVGTNYELESPDGEGLAKPRRYE